jgi:2-amino-4-hydroxy-6-hydroxymethyldihydropteridine diphosphokinase
MLHALIGLGANLGDPARAFANAIDKLALRGDVVSVSRLWRTRPLGPDQPDYCNAVVLIRWEGAPAGLLHASRDLEVAAGRNRSTEQRWGPRVLDLDLLMVRDLVWRGPELDLPHPRFHQRAFALVPSAELVPEWVHPFVGRTIGELAEEVLRDDPGALISSEPFPFAPSSLRVS